MSRKFKQEKIQDIEVLAEFFSFLNSTGTRAVIPDQLSGMLLQLGLSASLKSYGQPKILQVESLDAVLKQMTFDARRLTLWKK